MKNTCYKADETITITYSLDGKIHPLIGQYKALVDLDLASSFQDFIKAWAKKKRLTNQPHVREFVNWLETEGLITPSNKNVVDLGGIGWAQIGETHYNLRDMIDTLRSPVTNPQ